MYAVFLTPGKSKIMINKHTILTNYILALLLGLIVVSCTTKIDELEGSDNNREFTFSAELKIVTPAIASTRNGEIGELQSLRLLVFDENNQFLYSRVAVLGGINPTNQSYSYSVKLISSTQKRTIHFIANYDWDGFEQDYFLEGVDAGYILGSMITDKSTYWSLTEFEQLNKQTLNQVSIKLVNNQALISVESNAPDFQFAGFKVYYAYDRGTVASFDVDEQGQVNFFKDVGQLKPTIPSKYKMEIMDDFQLISRKVFERVSSSGQEPLFILIKGAHNGVDYHYYKIDLKKFDDATGITQLYDILRNHAYNIKITRVVGPGYDTEDKAAKAPASNNIFASLELKDFNAISNGKHELVVDILTQTLVKHPYTFEITTGYTEGLTKVKYHSSWGDDDPYLEPLDSSKSREGKIAVTTKQIPRDRTIVRTIDILASSDGQGQDIITRQVKLILQPPYNFSSSHIIRDGGKVDVYFNLSEKLDTSVYPLDIFVKADKLTPITSENGSNMVLVYIDGSYFYRFTFRERPPIQQQVLHFKKNHINDSSLGSILLSCFYFLDEDASLIKGN